MELVNSPSGQNILMPQGVALVATVRDSTGTYFNPESCGIVYGWDASGNMMSETADDGQNVWVKTYTWVDGVLSAESQWVKQ